jgi:16S rRNA (cytosine967-C5)-methyltransferase
VLIDSPCSGTGTWRRQPELRWRTTPEGLKSLTRLQDDLLEQGAPFVAAGGRLVYATCSLLPCENEDRIERFLSRHADFAVLPAATNWPKGTVRPPGLDRFFKATPLRTGTDGFFTAILQRAR